MQAGFNMALHVFIQKWRGNRNPIIGEDQLSMTASAKRIPIVAPRRLLRPFD